MRTTPANRATWITGILLMQLSLGTVLNGQAEGAVFELEEFEVRGVEFDAMRAAVLNQREADNIKTVVDSAAFGDVTEGNIGEFLKYLPGVSVDFVSADVRSVSVRGLNSNFTPVTMDGNRMASAASSTSSRTFEFEQVSLNNVARIEVVKVPTPNMEADSLGGSVNLISRNAFELDGRKLNYRAYLNIPGDYIRWSKTPGPGDSSTRKIRPGFDFTYSDPISENFGVVINYMQAETFTPQNYFITQWDTIRGVGEADPFLRYFNLRDGPKMSQRESIGIKADYRITPRSILSFGYQLNDYSTKFYNREVRWETGTRVGDYGPDFTNANPLNANGRFRHQINVREKLGQTNHVDLGMKHFWGDWQLSYDGYYSRSKNEYKDTANGHFERISYRTPSGGADGLAIGFADIGKDGPGTVITRSAGENFDPFPFTDFTGLELLRSSPEHATDTIYGTKADLVRNFTLGGLPASVQAGVLYRNQDRKINRERYEYTANSFFTTRSPGADSFVDENYRNRNLGWGWGAPTWPSVYRLHDYFTEFPDQFTLQEVASVRYNEENRQRLQEKVSAAYLMGTFSLMDGRLRVLGGVRYERTQTRGEGFELDEGVIFQRNPDGSFIPRNPDPRIPDNTQNRLFLPEFDNDLPGNRASPAMIAKRVRAQYTGIRATKSSYGDFYPSLHFTYQASDKLQVRLAYARTLGRPELSDIAPGIRYNSSTISDDGEEVNYITVNNPDLKAYSGDNYDLSLEYYFDGGGVLSVGVFYKEINGFIDSDRTPLTPGLAETFGIDPVYVDLGWSVERTINAGSVKIKGYEISYIQGLEFLPEYLQGFSVFANATALSSTADFGDYQGILVSSYIPGFVKQTLNWGVTYDRGPLDIRLKWNYRGKQMRDRGDIRGNFAGHTEANPSVWNRFYDKRLATDLNIEYRISKAVRIFLNGRNIFDVPTDQLRYGVDTPDYAQLERRERFGPLWSFGVKGTF